MYIIVYINLCEIYWVVQLLNSLLLWKNQLAILYFPLFVVSLISRIFICISIYACIFLYILMHNLLSGSVAPVAQPTCIFHCLLFYLILVFVSVCIFVCIFLYIFVWNSLSSWVVEQCAPVKQPTCQFWAQDNQTEHDSVNELKIYYR